QTLTKPAVLVGGGRWAGLRRRGRGSASLGLRGSERAVLLRRRSGGCRRGELLVGERAVADAAWGRRRAVEEALGEREGVDRCGVDGRGRGARCRPAGGRGSVGGGWARVVERGLREGIDLGGGLPRSPR